MQRWGIDIVGPLTTAQCNYKFVVVAVEYFTKWIKAKPLVNIVAARLKRFFLTKHNMSIWSAQGDNGQQRQAI
jgi:hypothetical protein